MNDMWVCICGKHIKEGEIYCSERCRWIAEKMNSPLAQRMDNVERAYRFFGKQWDKAH